jgi:2-polyprenyl-6-methoxyphenol hydroxylase-like FAD-dependent oxidoreductase
MATTTTNEQRPTVLIVGAGLGGVMLGALLEKANVPYTILERASTVRSLGKSPSLSLKAMIIHHFTT